MTARPSAIRPAHACAALLGLATLVLFWPGFAEYDTVAQYQQVLSGRYDDWHPPVMAHLWSLLHPLADGTAPLLMVQVVLYWTGLGAIAAALADRRRAAAVLALGALPLFLGWQVVVLKDAQMVGAALGATGLVAACRLRGTRVPVAVVAGATCLFAYALLVRANAVFALAPLIAALLPLRGGLRRGAATIAIVALVLGSAGAINHRLLAAEASGVEKTQPLYDLAGIAARSGAPDDTGLDRHDVAALRDRACVSPFFWDPLGEPSRCAPVMAHLHALPSADLYLLLARAALHHPLAYAAQRATHWNVTERWLVPARLPNAAPPAGNEPNTLGLRTPGRAATAWQRLAAPLADTPLAWPIAWTTAAVALLLLILGSPRPCDTVGAARRHLALGLIGSAIALEASFALVSIAADLRYHLWSMIATALALIVAPTPALTRRRAAVVAAAITVVLFPGYLARATLAAPPQTYQAMLAWQPGAIALLPR